MLRVSVYLFCYFNWHLISSSTIFVLSDLISTKKKLFNLLGQFFVCFWFLYTLTKYSKPMRLKYNQRLNCRLYYLKHFISWLSFRNGFVVAVWLICICFVIVVAVWRTQKYNTRSGEQRKREILHTTNH